jgi:transposase
MRGECGSGKGDPGGPVVAVFHYDHNRSGNAALQFLKGSRNGDVLMVDKSDSCNKPVQKYSLVVLSCMAHARRKFKEALDTGYKREYNKKVLSKNGQLYRLERFADKLDANTEKQYQLRQIYSRKILDEIKKLLTNSGFPVLPSRKVGEAINYMLNHWEPLTRFTENGLYPIDNNPVERIIRPLAIGRKNWMFAGSEAGAKWCAVYYSIFATCQLNGIDPEKYLEDVLMRLAIRPENADVKDLLPGNLAENNAGREIKYPKN